MKVRVAIDDSLHHGTPRWARGDAVEVVGTVGNFYKVILPGGGEYKFLKREVVGENELVPDKAAAIVPRTEKKAVRGLLSLLEE
jgi:hypothetical protein